MVMIKKMSDSLTPVDFYRPGTTKKSRVRAEGETQGSRTEKTALIEGCSLFLLSCNDKIKDAVFCS